MLGTAGTGYGAVNAAQAYMNFEQQISTVGQEYTNSKPTVEQQSPPLLSFRPANRKHRRREDLPQKKIDPRFRLC